MICWVLVNGALEWMFGAAAGQGGRLWHGAIAVATNLCPVSYSVYAGVG
jgi:hypothetical protein